MSQEVIDKNEIEIAVESNDAEEIYFNGFATALATNDFIIVLTRNGKRRAVLNASHVTAKALAARIMESIEKFEQQTNTTILTVEQPMAQEVTNHHA
jgi:hypothetical protein